MDHLRVRTALLIALLSSVPGAGPAQCRPVVPEAYEMTSVGRVWLRVSAERGSLPSDEPHTFVGAWLNREEKPNAKLHARILNIWVRRDSVWTALRIQPFDEKTRERTYVYALGGPAWDPGTNIDVLTEWQLAGESAPHCSLLRSTVTAVLFTAPTVIARESTTRDSAGVQNNTGRLVLALRDANNPLSPIKEKSSIAVAPGSWPGRVNDVRQIFAESETDIISFDRVPAKQVALTVSAGRFQYFRAMVDIFAGCETVVEVFLGPQIVVHAPPVTEAHATVTTCAPVRCLGGNNMVIPCPPITMPVRPPIVKRKLQLR
ncbi:MAG: hypothetical protein H7Z40_14315 [Phycisphaerae bacterium]|nr:hypothetical protein [Gemmatimonadaceae bacterium]